MKGAQVIFPWADGEGWVNFLGNPEQGGLFSLPFWVVGTDYDNYIVVYSCMDFGFTGLFYLDAMWIMVRDLNYNYDGVKSWFATQKELGTLKVTSTYTFPDTFHKTV